MFCSGAKFTQTERAECGDLAAVSGLSATYPGQGLGDEDSALPPLLEPVLSYRILLPGDCDARTFLPKLKRLEDEDPTLKLDKTDNVHELQARLMGEMQIEILKNLFRSGSALKFRLMTGEFYTAKRFLPLLKVSGILNRCGITRRFICCWSRCPRGAGLFSPPHVRLIHSIRIFKGLCWRISAKNSSRCADGFTDNGYEADPRCGAGEPSPYRGRRFPTGNLSRRTAGIDVRAKHPVGALLLVPT